MKLIFSLLLMGAINVNAFVININSLSSPQNALEIKRIFEQRYQIPSILISIKEKGCYEEVDSRMINLCITKKGKLILLPSNIKFLRNSLKIFRTSHGEVQNVL